MRISSFAVILLVAVACNRVPAPETPPVAIAAAPEPDASSTPQGAEPEEDDAIEGLCARACESWVTLRFQAPVGWGQMSDASKPTAMELLVRQKALNRAECEERCVRAGKPDVARCLLRAKNAEDATTCAAR